MRHQIFLLGLTIALVVGVGLAIASPAVTVAQQVAAAPSGFVDSFSVSCTSASAVEIAPPSGKRMLSYACTNESSTLVHIGDSGIADPGTTRNAPAICSSCALGATAYGDVQSEYCRGDVDTTIYGRAVVSAAPLGPPCDFTWLWSFVCSRSR